MKKMILDLSQTVQALRKTSPQAAADQTVPLIIEPVATGASSNSRDTSFGEGSLRPIFASHPISHTTRLQAK